MMSTRSNILITTAIILILVLVFSDVDAQCSMCRKIASDGASGEKKFGNNLNSAILYLMALPYVALGFIFRSQIVSFIKQMRGK